MTITVPTLAIVLPILALVLWAWVKVTAPLIHRFVFWIGRRWIGPEPTPSWQKPCPYCGCTIGSHKPREFQECRRLLAAAITEADQ